MANTFSKLKINIRNGFPIEFRVDIGVTGSIDRQNSPEPLQSPKTYCFSRILSSLKKNTAIFPIKPGGFWYPLKDTMSAKYTEIIKYAKKVPFTSAGHNFTSSLSLTRRGIQRKKPPKRALLRCSGLGEQPLRWSCTALRWSFAH